MSSTNTIETARTLIAKIRENPPETAEAVWERVHECKELLEQVVLYAVREEMGPLGRAGAASAPSPPLPFGKGGPTEIPKGPSVSLHSLAAGRMAVELLNALVVFPSLPRELVPALHKRASLLALKLPSDTLVKAAEALKEEDWMDRLRRVGGMVGEVVEKGERLEFLGGLVRGLVELFVRCFCGVFGGEREEEIWSRVYFLRLPTEVLVEGLMDAALGGKRQGKIGLRYMAGVEALIVRVCMRVGGAEAMLGHVVANAAEAWRGKAVDQMCRMLVRCRRHRKLEGVLLCPRIEEVWKSPGVQLASGDTRLELTKAALGLGGAVQVQGLFPELCRELEGDEVRRMDLVVREVEVLKSAVVDAEIAAKLFQTLGPALVSEAVREQSTNKLLQDAPPETCVSIVRSAAALAPREAVSETIKKLYTSLEALELVICSGPETAGAALGFRDYDDESKCVRSFVTLHALETLGKGGISAEAVEAMIDIVLASDESFDKDVLVACIVALTGIAAGLEDGVHFPKDKRVTLIAKLNEIWASRETYDSEVVSAAQTALSTLLGGFRSAETTIPKVEWTEDTAKKYHEIGRELEHIAEILEDPSPPAQMGGLAMLAALLRGSDVEHERSEKGRRGMLRRHKALDPVAAITPIPKLASSATSRDTVRQAVEENDSLVRAIVRICLQAAESEDDSVGVASADTLEAALSLAPIRFSHYINKLLLHPLPTTSLPSLQRLIQLSRVLEALVRSIRRRNSIASDRERSILSRGPLFWTGDVSVLNLSDTTQSQLSDLDPSSETHATTSVHFQAWNHVRSLAVTALSQLTTPSTSSTTITTVSHLLDHSPPLDLRRSAVLCLCHILLSTIPDDGTPIQAHNLPNALSAAEKLSTIVHSDPDPTIRGHAQVALQTATPALPLSKSSPLIQMLD